MFPSIDPSKLDPKAIAELSELMRTLPYDKLMKMQSLMQSAMTGKDIRSEIEAFERDLPADFRAKLFDILMRHGQSFQQAAAFSGAPTPSSATAEPVETSVSPELSAREARLTILRAVAAGKMTPEEAETLL